ncbi:tRNA (adenosine(37)-N6)-threonylcarbamoyltransferase complex transferase subunit TsaD [Candidatus Falkowbacteria bacterium CG10_big_fil_rev_8_21_14_0_10_44_15]|uniref:tRNA N6-adenosine threonylcarbamoyltransferase n=1 Tax=Candidatus Falkowbacteria bacterium CG10_big_fil_rev_8_21_14_0_10_44_15 TaxID=1974569 RepID=A0A2H0V016_9BACT|nr:MAG: tRNA (adenosine(37)-N6)-threonylcarbamoyltransferase complex transferase subunit TsaD [Candidatus Falkowbacteria bacterium CG10_big_fil_rev_8_21_14_0_10_44_15]
MTENMIILAIESSCDETAAAIIEGKAEKIKVISNVVSSQIKIHRPYGGVIPELAARNHIKNILPVIDRALAPIARKKRSGRGVGGEGVDAIAITTGPGLISSLLIGIETAKALAYAWRKPIVGINHLAGHIYSNFIVNSSPHLHRGVLNPNTNFGVGVNPAGKNITGRCGDKKIKFPALVLIVSGGHTELVLMRGHFKFKLLGQTRDDAAGEAFDKAAKILGLGYPGGPAIAAAATKTSNIKYPTSNINLPRPMLNDTAFDFSFSGLKTALLYKIQGDKNWRHKIPAYCAEFQQAIIDVLISKTVKAAKKYKVKSVMLAGGVAANLELREQLGLAVRLGFKTQSDFPAYYTPDLQYTTDNAAMIAAAGYFYLKNVKTKKPRNIRVDCNQSLTK